MIGLFVILGGMFCGFILIEKYPKHHPMVVAFATLLVLVVFNYIPADKAFKGLSSRAALTVAFTMFCAQSFEVAGGVDALGALANRAKSKKNILYLIYLMCTAISAVINNISAMYLMLPIGKRICRDLKISSKIFVMALAFCALIGGMLTSIGSPPGVIIMEKRREALGINGGLFYETPLALIVVIFALAAICFFATRFFPSKHIVYNGDFKKSEYLFVLRVKEDLGKSFEDIFPKSQPNRPTGLAVRQQKGRRIELSAAEDVLLKPEDIFVVKCVHKETAAMLESCLKAENVGLKVLEDMNLLHVVELGEQSRLLGSSPEEENSASTLDVRFLAVARNDGVVQYNNIGALNFEPNTSYLVLAKPHKIKRFTRLQDLPSEIDDREFKPSFSKIAVSIGSLACAIILSSFEVIPLEIALAIACFINYWFGDLKVKSKVVEDILLMFGLVAIMIPIGNAIEENGAAKVIAESILWLTSFVPGLSPNICGLLGILLASIIIANVIDNAASAQIMLPIAIAAAAILKVSPDPFFSAIWIGVSTTFMLPIGHNCTILAQRECRYSTLDFIKFGGLLTVLTIVVSMIAIPLLRSF